jgi:hypothetical protein
MTASRAEISTPLLAVYDGPNCIGRLLSRRQAAVEAVSTDGISLGVYETEATAAAALWRHVHGPTP